MDRSAVMRSHATVVVGPATITGPESVDGELVSQALDCIDDPLGLQGRAVVDSDRIWCAVISAAVGGEAGAVTVVFPTWWTSVRIRRVQRSAQHCAANVIAQQRDDVLRAVAGWPTCVVVEVGQDLVRIARPGVAAVPLRRTMSMSDAVLAHVRATDDVVVDAPAAVPGAAELASEIAEQLRNRGVQARILRCPDLLEHVDMESTTPPDTDISRRRFWTRTAVIGVGVISVAGSLVLAVPHDGGAHPDPVAVATPTELTWMVEGRVAVQVPAQWAVDRVASGSGSARVQVISPTDPAQALHITQTLVPPGHTLEQAARSLRDAASGLPVGVVVDFNGGGTSAGRSAVTYREVRAGKVVDWSVVLDGPVRIAIGCQGAAARPHCETAVRSAHRVG